MASNTHDPTISLFRATALAASLQGWLLQRTNWLMRILLLLTALLTIEPTVILDLIGLLIFLAVLIWQLKEKKQQIRKSKLVFENE